jgi:hypothetical protein
MHLRLPILASLSALLLAASAAAFAQTPAPMDPNTPIPKDVIARGVAARTQLCVDEWRAEGWKRNKAKSYCTCSTAEDTTAMKQIKTLKEMQAWMEADSVEKGKYEDKDPAVVAKFQTRHERCLAQAGK